MEASGTPAPGPTNGDSNPARTWKIVAGVLAVVAIGLGIWAITTKSDLDDANKKLDNKEQALSGAETTEQAEEAVDDQLRSEYRQVRRKLSRERRQASRLRADVRRESAQLQSARNQLSEAKSTQQRQKAELRVAQEERDVAAACARGVLGATDDFFEAAETKAGAKAAVRRLESLQTQCRTALS